MRILLDTLKKILKSLIYYYIKILFYKLNNFIILYNFNNNNIYSYIYYKRV